MDADSGIAAGANAVAPPTVPDIDSLPVSDTWKRRFKAMHKAGGPNLPNLKQLPPEDRKDIATFSIVAFFLGPLYYLAKGMWKKGLTLFALCFVAIVVIDLVMQLVGLGKYTEATRFVAPAVFGALANRDYYSKMVLGQNGWWWPKD